MRICIPVNENNGVDSTVCAHFGSAPFFMIVDTDSLVCKAVVNTNQHHSHGMCQPLAALKDEDFDGIVVGGIGAGALNKLAAANISVYKTEHATIRETVTAAKNNQLKTFAPNMACSGHHH
ncbi:MAG: NifB/NifX family molybdenum-iron cluster-binding protein [Oligoflexia bacterium]|nr:NifB/NifX family molybdenum-iron cluster-binding protein [Oligoflexia bacterium]